MRSGADSALAGREPIGRAAAGSMTAASAKAAWLMVALLLSAASVLPRALFVRFVSDDGLVGAWALLVRAGLAPYRDFVVAVPPATPLLYAAAFDVFGPSYQVLRAVTAVAIVASGGLIMAIGMELTDRKVALVAAVTWVGWATIYIQYGSYHYWSTALALGAVLALMISNQGSGARTWAPLLAGVMTALAVLFLQSLAILVPFAVAALWLLPTGRVRRLLSYTAGGLAVTVITIVYLAANRSLGPFIEQTTGYALGVYARIADVPIPLEPFDLRDATGYEYGGLAGPAAMLVVWTLGLLVPVLVTGWLIRLLFRGRAAWGGKPGVTVSLMSTALFLSALATHRPAAAQLWFAAPLAVILAGAWLWSAIRGRPRLRARHVAALAVMLLVLLWPAPQGWTTSCALRQQGPWRQVSFETGVVCSPKRDVQAYRQATTFSAEHRSQSMAFLPMSDPLYLLSGRTPPISEGLFVMPGLLPPKRLATLESQLVEQRVEWVLYQPFDWKDEWLSLPGNTELLHADPWSFEVFLSEHYDLVPSAGPLIQYHLRAAAPNSSNGWLD